MEPIYPSGIEETSGTNSTPEHGFRVVDDLPPEIPVTPAEIDLLARFCRDILDAYLRFAPSPTSHARGPLSSGLNRKAGGE